MIDPLALFQYLKQAEADANTFSGLFDWEGNLIHGDKSLSVERIPTHQGDDKWFYTIKAPDGYVAVPIPVIPSVFYDFGVTNVAPQGGTSSNPRADYFRFVGIPLSSMVSGGAPNVLVNFMVFAYRPDVLIAKKK